MAQTRYDNVTAGEYARQHNGNVTNNYRYNYGLRTRRSDETLREDQRNVLVLRAAAEGQLPRMQHLFRLGVDIDFSDDEGFMALHHAVLSGFEDCVKELINWGSDVNAMTRYGVPLNLAAQKERGHVISILVGARADKVRAVDFAVAHGQSVGDLCSLLNFSFARTTADIVPVLPASNARRENATGEDQPANPIAAGTGTQADAETDLLDASTNRESTTENGEPRHRNLQRDSSARREESHSKGGIEISAGEKGEDLGCDSFSEDLSEKLYSSPLSQQSVRQTKKSTSRSHKNLWRKLGVTDVEDLSNLTPSQWRQADYECEDYDTPRPHRGTHSIFSRKVTGELVWRELLQQPPPKGSLDEPLSTVCQKLDEDRELQLKKNRKVELHVRDWLLQQPPVMLHLVPQSDRSTSQKLKVQAPIDDHRAKDSAHRRPGRSETPTENSFAVPARRKYWGGITKEGGEQRLIVPSRRGASQEQSTRKAIEKPIRQSERTEISSPDHELSGSQLRRRERRRERGRPLANDRLTPEAVTSNSPEVRYVHSEGSQRSSMVNNPRLLEIVEDTIKRFILPEVNAIRKEQKAGRFRRSPEAYVDLATRGDSDDSGSVTPGVILDPEENSERTRDTAAGAISHLAGEV